MTNLPNPLQTLQKIDESFYYSLPALENQGLNISKLPISIRIILESLLRNYDGMKITEMDILNLAKWENQGRMGGEVPFIVSRVLLQDFTGVPLLVDLAAMRDAVAEQGYDPSIIEPRVPVDLVVDHSVQVDRSGTNDAYDFNIKLEFERNIERYEFLKWGQEAFETFKVVPPGIGIVHQVNLEHLAHLVSEKKVGQDNILFFDTLVGTDSHTTMINGLGIVGWGVGGIEAEAAMLGQPVALQMPEVIGFHLDGKMPEGATATDLALRITEILRKEHVVDKFIEFFGEGVACLNVADRATIANMAPEYGATMGFFPIDNKTLEYLRVTGRDEKQIQKIQKYLEAQKIFGVKKKGELQFTKVIDLDLNTVSACVSGPKRPQDRIGLYDIKNQFNSLLKKPLSAGGYGKENESVPAVVKVIPHGSFIEKNHKDSGGLEYNPPGAPRDVEEMVGNRPYTCAIVKPGYSDASIEEVELTHGSVVIAAITSCTNTSNPAVMLAAGLVAKKAVEKGLKVKPFVKTSLAPGSRVVTEYLRKAGLQKYLDQLGFQLVGYGCTTCIGNSGPIDESIENGIKSQDLIATSVLSGNRNFEARIHSAVKANFLMSPPLVVAFALAGNVSIDMSKEPLGLDPNGKAVYLQDLWPSQNEIESLITSCVHPSMFKERYAHILEDNPLWKKIRSTSSMQYRWNAESTYIQKPPYFKNFSLKTQSLPPLKNLYCLALLGDSVTTDHISPAGAFKPSSPAGKFLLQKGVAEQEFNSYGSRRGNHYVMMRGTFANVRITNKMAGGKEGGFTKHIPTNTILSIFDACEEYAKAQSSLIIFAGKDYGMGSSRDWAAKGTNLLGIKAVVAQSFERIHRSNLIGMGVLPLEFLDGTSHESLGIEGDELFTIAECNKKIQPGQQTTLEITKNGKTRQVPLKVRLDTEIEVEYYLNEGILPYVMRQILSE
jgi:aconitate hydratase